ncbi:MAG: sulfatase-like hydrolase/transferase, partial [Myxococcota bacterium]
MTSAWARRRALATTVLWLVGSACSPGRMERPNIVLIVLDTVRADRIACYGYERPTSPRIDELAARGIRFENASSTSSWTLPAHASLFTGVYPIDHGATQEHPRLEADKRTLAEILGGYGYATLAVSANPLVGSVTGLRRGFHRYTETWRGTGAAAGDDPRAHPNLRAARSLLQEKESGQPFFLFLNFMEAHSPYTPREPYRSRFLSHAESDPLVASAENRRVADFYLSPESVPRRELDILSDLYDAEIAEVDELVGVFVDELEALGALENTLVVITSDHGENFGDHGHFR